jgi:hypothetical protein
MEPSEQAEVELHFWKVNLRMKILRQTTPSSTPELDGSDLINDFHDNNNTYLNFEIEYSDIPHTPFEEIGLSLPASLVNGNIQWQ